MTTALVEAFGLVVRRQREFRQWSQEHLAEVADLNRSYVGEIERAEVVASLTTVGKLAEALGTTSSTLLGEAEQIRQARLAQGLRLTAIAC